MAFYNDLPPEWSSHSRYDIYSQSSGLRRRTPQDYLFAMAVEGGREDRQAEYFKSLYSQKVKRIQKEVEDTCDRLDYTGSFIYDEYPDSISLERTCRQICEELRKEDCFTEEEEALFEMSELRRRPPIPPPKPPEPPGPFIPGIPPVPPAPPPGPPRRENWLEDMVKVLLYQEMNSRRCRRRGCRYFRNLL